MRLAGSRAGVARRSEPLTRPTACIRSGSRARQSIAAPGSRAVRRRGRTAFGCGCGYGQSGGRQQQRSTGFGVDGPRERHTRARGSAAADVCPLRHAGALMPALRPRPTLLRQGLFRGGQTGRPARGSAALPEQPWWPRCPCSAIPTVATGSTCRPWRSAPRDASGWFCRTRHSARRGFGAGWSRQRTTALQGLVGLSMHPLSWRTRAVGTARTLAPGSSATATSSSSDRRSGSGTLTPPAYSPAGQNRHLTSV